MWIHTVYFWTHEGTPPAAIEQLVSDCNTYLAKIPSVKQLWVGTPAPTNRDVVDKSYQVGLTVVLADSAGHDVYQIHDLHLEFIKRNKAIWKRVQIYDFVTPQ